MSISKNEKSVQFAGRTLIVFEVPPTLRVNLRMTEIRAKEAANLAGREGEVGALEGFYYTEIYPCLAVCTKAEDGLPIPTSDDLFDCLDIQQSNEWYTAAKEKNAHLFPKLEEEEPDKLEEVKKKRVRSRRSVQPSA